MKPLPVHSLASYSPSFRSLALATSIALLLFPQERVAAQGCIAVKSPPGSPLLDAYMFNQSITDPASLHATTQDGKGKVQMEPERIADKKWTASVEYRWFHSDRHFSRDVEQTQRFEEDSQVENDVHLIDTSLGYAFTRRFSGTLTIPYGFYERSSLYEHDFVHRNSMRSNGLGDIRFSFDYWIFDPLKCRDGNLALGLGVKFPTGDDDATATAHRATGDVTRPVDPSIQPGDGGWGIIVQLQGYQKVVKGLYAYVSAQYLSTPQEQSDTELTVADVPAFQEFITDEIRHNTIADQYYARAGLSYDIWPAAGLALSFGGRIEGIPSKDIIGDDMGFRRPGYTVSLEPGITWTTKNTSVSVSVPFAVYRNRVRSAPEEKLGRPAGDAAFADYFIQASVSYRF
jgi:hypothetical protein